MTEDSSLPAFPRRKRDSHKGNFGHAWLIGGSRGMAGSIALAGMACVQAGAGLTTLAVPDCILETVAGYSPNYMTMALANDAAGRLDSKALDTLTSQLVRATAIGLGPGLGRTDSVAAMVRGLLASTKVPMVIDADALRALSGDPREIGAQEGPRILTPHPGEFEFLTGCSAKSRELQLQAAARVAQEWSVIVVLKGANTMVTDGRRSYYNRTGNPGMATGGSGDCLTGIIAALLCQGLGAFEAAKLGVYLHGLAGDLAQARLQAQVVPPTELIQSLAQAISQFVEKQGPVD